MPGENLTLEESVERAATITAKAYEVDLDLTTGDSTFDCTTTIYFDAKEGSGSFVDLIAKEVSSVTLNGVLLDPASVFTDSRIWLENLSAQNTLIVKSVQIFMNSGEGLHRFVDPADGEVYLYSQFQVPDARRMFPVFEQPDMKATFQFTVTAPARWKVVSVQPTPESELQGIKDGEEIAKWVFDPTPVMSSYITALIAGPYHEKRSELTNADGRVIPLGIFCRKSLSPFLDADYLFEKTRQGFKFFSESFDYPYPFAKYDQLFVPEYNAGAMENIGAVTFTEAYVFRGQVTDAMKERRVVTILHELAHMWFGDLVTMKWWNDLWLNESFAEYMSILATAEATEWQDAWTTFVASEKTWAYRQDQLPSTHPIVANIRDLDDVLVNFDGITYAKGASVLKQLVAWVGRDAFMKGVHNYFVKHAYGNTVLTDLLVELEKTSGRDLNEWVQLWLETAGVNTLRASFSLNEDDSFSSFQVLQAESTDSFILRAHRIGIGLYNFNEYGQLVRTGEFECDISGSETDIPELVGAKQPDLLVLNDKDLSYAKLRFDERSLVTIKQSLRKISDPLTRALVWSAMWDITRDAEMKPSEFIKLVLENIASETNSTMMRTVLGQLKTAATLYTPEKLRRNTVETVADAMWDLAQNASSGSDAQFQFVKVFADLACTQKHTEIIEKLLDKTIKLDGINIDKDLTWEFLIALTANGVTGSELIDATLREDLTASGQQSAIHARASIPSAGAKAEIWENIVLNPGSSNLIIRHAAIGFMRTTDVSTLEFYLNSFFTELEEIWETRSFAISEEIITGFYPMVMANQTLLDATKSWLDDNPHTAPALRRYMLENLADVERALTVQKTE